MSAYDDESRPDTPLASQHNAALVPPSNQLLSPQQVPQTQHAFALSDVVNEDDKNFEPWPEDLAGVDINIAPDSTYIETDSGPAARELKRRYDQRYGVSVTVRSPYAITAFVNQHGKQMFRVGHRELSAPAASSAEVAAEIESKTSSETSHSPRTKRRSRMSTIFPPGVFTKGGTAASSRPNTAVQTQSSVPKKLRKARSIDMASLGGDATEHGELSHGQPLASTFSGRAHSQSVTAVDIPRYVVPPPSRTVDIFGEVMDWFAPLSSAASSLSSHSGHDSRPIIPHPFGAGVTFESPLKKPVFEYLPPPRHLRVMHSFESGMTARQDDSHVVPEGNFHLADVEEHRPPSAIRVADRGFSLSEIASRPSSTYEPPAEASLLTQYATTVFDVLQTYRGLPNLDKLSLESEATTVRISLSADQSAAPRDDPRFVIWGDSVPDWDQDGYSVSRDSIASNVSSSGPVSSLSKRRTSKASKARASQPSSHRASISLAPQRLLIAATIERWIAQLTSDLNYDELLDFFLTYRTYISGVDLCHLLISRFHWALQQPQSSQDEGVRRIVRVRTFVAIRYWLLTFFTVDFVPNRELRLLMSNWLNTMIHDPLLEQHADGLGIVRRLAKVAKECKQAHMRATGSTTAEKEKSSPPKSQRVKSHVLGQKFAEAVLKDEDDSDVDLDFLPEEALPENPALGPDDPVNAHIAAAQVGSVLSPTRPTSLPLSSFNILQRIDHSSGPSTDASSSSNPMPAAIPMQHSALSRAFVKTIGRLGRLKRVLHSRSSTRNSLNPCTGISSFDLELSVSRDLLTVNGGVEQYLKGIEPLSTRQQPPPPLTFKVDRPPLPPPSAPSVLQSLPSASSPSLDVASHIPPASATLPAHSGLPQSSVLSPFPQQPITPITPTTPTQRLTPENPPEVSIPALSPKQTAPDTPPDYNIVEPPLPTPPPEEVHEQQLFLPHLSEQFNFDDVEVDMRVPFSQRAESIRSFASSTGSLGEVLDGRGSMQPTFARLDQEGYQYKIASVDELDLSDTSSEFGAAADPMVPPGLRKQTRKLPMRKDFEFLPRRSEVSSMGIVSRGSIASGPSSSGTTSSASFGGLGGNIQQWQMNALLDSLSNDEESGDVADALRRLEGQLNPQKMQEKRSKVDGWVKQIQARLATGDYENEESRFPVDSDEEDEEDSGQEARPNDDGDDDDDERHESASQQDVALFGPPGLDSSSFKVGAEDRRFNDDGPEVEKARTPIPTPTTLNVPSVSSSSSEVGSLGREAKPPVEDVVPIEILQSRVSTILPPNDALSHATPDIPGHVTSKFTRHDGLRVHQSFILSSRAITLAEQFAMIDRELFMGVKFEELVTEEWMATEEVNVYDWSQYLKDRARWKAEHRNTEKTTALAAIRARFNLMANFVISEIVLTQPSQRSFVVGKFIRVAWKSYELSNFNTLVAIVAALQSDWVSQAMRKPGWNRVGSFEARVFRDLKTFVSGRDDFLVIRRAVESIVDAKPIETSSHAPSITSGGAPIENQSAKGKPEARPTVPTACIPFIGMYLAQLYRLKRLPDLVDPTSPNEAVGMNPATGDFNPPAHPEVFAALAPLPPAMRLEPLVNVHKQRKIAAVIKSLVAGQHIASRVNIEVDKKLFQRCLRLRALEPDVLQRAVAVYAE